MVYNIDEGVNNLKVDHTKEEKRVVYTEVTKENMEWLKRSVVGKTKKTYEFWAYSRQNSHEWLCVSNIREMGAFKALITFEIVEDMEEALAFNMELLHNHFAEIRRWLVKRDVTPERFGLNLWCPTSCLVCGEFHQEW